MQQLTVGLIPAPESPSILIAKIKDDLCTHFERNVDSKIEWNIDIEVDPLTGAAECVEDIIDEAALLKKKKDWDFSICITDLPIFSDGHLVIADANGQNGVAQISLPAFGFMPTKKRLTKAIVQMVCELYYAKYVDDKIEWANRDIGPMLKSEEKGVINTLKKIFFFSPIKRINSPENQNKIYNRFIIVPKTLAKYRVLMGMTIANRPWTIMPSFKRVVAVAFATGAYGLIFNTLWKLSVSYELSRFFGLMFGAISGMIIWIIFAHNLWEPKTDKNKERLRNLYNLTTIFTLGITVLMYYITLFILLLIAVLFYVPPDMFKETVGLQHDITPMNYLKLAWLVTSVATVAGAIGAGLENDTKVRNVTYGYRQHHRYAQMQNEKEKEEKKEEKEAKEQEDPTDK